MDRKITDKKLEQLLDKAGGNFYAVAADLGERPYKLYDRAITTVKSEFLRGKMFVYRDEGQRLQNARRFQSENVKLRRELRAAADFHNLGEDLAKALARKDWPKRKWNKATEIKFAPDDRPSEILFSDLHYGKSCSGFNCEIAEHRVAQYADAVKTAHKTYHPTHTTIAFLGDLIENPIKHRDSQLGCGGLGVSEQIVGAYRCIKKFLEQVIPTCGKEVDIVGVSGNHENPMGGGSMMTSPGVNHYTWIIYSLLADHFESFVQNITWHVPEGNYAFLPRTGTVYEHGDQVQPNDKSMATQRMKRSNQAGQFVHRYRQGDKHVAVAADGVNLICNGAFYSDKDGTEFSGIMGYSSDPQQVMVMRRNVKFVRLT